MTQAATGKKNSHQQMIGADGGVARRAFAMSQAHRQAHGPLGFGISAQTPRDRTFGRGGFLVDDFANARTIDGQRAQGSSGERIRIGQKAQEKMFLAQVSVGIAAGLGVGLLERHSRGGGEIVDELDGPIGRLSRLAPRAGLVLGLFLQPYCQASLGN